MGKYVVTYTEAEINTVSNKLGISPAQIQVIVDALNEAVNDWIEGDS